MGNRAVITFDKNPTPKSVGIYLHWNGGPESVLAFLEAAEKLGVRDGSDSPYQLARVVQIIGNYFGGTCSVGVGTLDTLDCDNGDNGTFAVTREGGKIIIRHSKNGKNHWQELDLDEIKKHKYWENNDILNNILEKNTAIFSKE